MILLLNKLQNCRLEEIFGSLAQELVNRTDNTNKFALYYRGRDCLFEISYFSFQSSMSEKSLLSRRLRRSMTNWSSGQSSKDHFSDGTISFPKSKRSKAKQKFRIVAAKTGQPDGISFECIDKPGCFLRAKGKSLSPEREGSDSYFSKLLI